jgi:hypothetical protein
LPADGLGLDGDRAEALGGGVHRCGEPGRAGADDDQVGHAVDVDLVGASVDADREVVDRRDREGDVVVPLDHRVRRGPVTVEAGQDVLADVAVGVVDEVGDADSVEVVADGEGQPVARRRHDSEGLDHGLGDGLVPVRQELADRRVELLVALAARHQEVGVVLALGESVAQSLGVLAEAVPVSRDHASTGGHVLAQVVERLKDVHVGQHGLRHHQRELPAGGQRLHDLARLGGAVRGTKVVVAGIAAELVE